MDAKQNVRKSQRTGPVKIQKATGQKKASNIRVLRPKPKTRTKINYGRVLLFGLIIYFIIWAIYPITYRIQQSKELERLKSKLSMIKKENEALQKEVNYLSSDEYVEQKARSLGLSKADEEVVVVIPPVSENSKKPLKEPVNRAEKKNENKPPASLWARITSFFSSVF